MFQGKAKTQQCLQVFPAASLSNPSSEGASSGQWSGAPPGQGLSLRDSSVFLPYPMVEGKLPTTGQRGPFGFKPAPPCLLLVQCRVHGECFAHVRGPGQTADCRWGLLHSEPPP